MSVLHRGILCIVASALGFASMAFFVRFADDFGVPLSCFQKGFFRNAVALAIAIVAFVGMGRDVDRTTLKVPKGAYPILFARCLAGSFGIFANFYAISHIQVGEAMTLNKTAPFFTVLFSFIFLHERATWRQLGCLALAFFGAMLVVKPGLRTDSMAAALLGLAGGLGAGLAYTCVHQLGRMKVPGVLIVLAFSAFSCVASIPFMVADFRPMTWLQILILLGAGAGAALGQFGITAAYRYAEPRAIAVYDYTGVVFSALLGLVFLGQVPDIASAIGFVVILISAMVI